MARVVSRQIIKRYGLTDAPGNGATITLLQAPMGPPSTGATPQGLGAQIFAPEFNWIVFLIKSSHDSAAGGIIADVSFDDGTNFDTLGTSSYLAANGLYKFKKHAPVGGIFRLRYQNSANVLTTFRGGLYWSSEETED